MSLLPLRPLHVNGSPEGALTIRAALQPDGLHAVYVRREHDKKTWCCRVRSLLEILVPDQQVGQLDVAAVLTCLYHGVAYDSTSSTAAPLELQRREVGFSQPESWTDGSYRLVMRVVLRDTSMAMSTPMVDANSHAAQAIPLASLAEEAFVFGFTMVPTMTNLAHVHDVGRTHGKRCVTVQLQEPAFPHELLNWTPSPDDSVARVVDDAIQLMGEGMYYRPAITKVVTLKIVHAKTPALFVVSIKSVAIQPLNTTIYQPMPGCELYHTIMKYDVGVPSGSPLQVAVLPGSACVLEGSSITIRERVNPAPTVAGSGGGKMGK